MIFLVYKCQAADEVVTLNPEFEQYAWVAQDSLMEYELNVETVKTFSRLIEGSSRAQPMTMITV